MADTIFALSSGRPPAAIAVIRISGPFAHAAAERLTGSLPAARAAGLREIRHPDTGARLDHGLVLRFDAPASSTGEDIVEIQCHGGRAIVDSVRAALATVEGVREAMPGEFTRRAFENGRIDLTEAEGLADLIEAETETQRKAALAVAEGGLRRQIAAWQDQLLSLSARAELAIDYDDETVSLDPKMLRDCGVLASELAEWLKQPRIEPLKDGVLVVVAGLPNAGKSSLVNAIAGSDKAIVTEVPGTTRDSIEVPLALGGVPIRLTDTAGLRETNDSVEAIGIGRANMLVECADVVIWLGESGDAPDHPRLIKVHSKADLPGRALGPSGAFAVSAVTRAGLPELLERVQALARRVMPSEDKLALNRRQAGHMTEAAEALVEASNATDHVILAENLRLARGSFDKLSGRAGVEDLLDALFGRFCLGK